MVIPDEAKNGHVKGQREEGIEDRPDDSQIAPPMPHLHRAHGKLPPKIAVAEKVLQQRRLKHAKDAYGKAKAKQGQACKKVLSSDGDTAMTL
jgi:hypothetical protein